MSSRMRAVLTALALGLGFALPVPMVFAQGVDPLPDPSAVLDASRHDPAVPPYPQAEDTTADNALADALTQVQGRRPAGIAERLAGWVSDTDDNGEWPFMIVDKLGAHVFAFDAGGRFLGSAPVLVGLARGDNSAPGIGDLKLPQISADERTTPAGRFVAGFGRSAGHGTMLWVDLRDAISLHPVMSVNAGEHRFRRIKSSDPLEHRISYGCINVPKSFYDNVVLTALAGGNAIVYVLPDTKPIDDFFPAFAAASKAGTDSADLSEPTASGMPSADLAQSR